MKIKKILTPFIGLSLTLTLALPALAAESAPDAEMQANMAKMQAAATPGSGHEVLKDLEGQWTVTSRSWMKPGDKPKASQGSSTMSWVLDGRFLKQEYQGNWAGQNFTGFGYLGYDNVKKAYVSVWMDSMSTGIAQSTGQYDPASKTITDRMTFSCPIQQKEISARAEWKLISKDKFSYTMYMQGPDGKEFKSMELSYQRAK